MGNNCRVFNATVIFNLTFSENFYIIYIEDRKGIKKGISYDTLHS